MTSKTIDYTNIFKPDSAVTSYVFLRNNFFETHELKFDTIYQSMKPVREIAKKIGMRKELIDKLPTAKNLSRYEIVDYTERRQYIRGSIIRNKDNNTIISSSICLNDVVFLNFFVHRAGMFNFPLKKPACKKGVDRIKITAEEVFEFIDDIFCHRMSVEEKKEFFKIK
jgi:hypothetical protein